MSHDERIVIYLSILAFAVMLFAKLKGMGTSDAVTDQGALSLTPMTFNQSPGFMFAPPVANIMPNSAASLAGSTAGAENHLYYDPTCGCGI